MSVRRVLVTVVLGSAVGCALVHERAFDANVDAPGPPGLLASCPSPMAGLTRDCGWMLAGTFSCRPGASVAIGCDIACGLGSCTGDSMIRVCAGASACLSSQAIGADDDSPCGGGLCSTVRQVTCPASGQFTVLTAPFSSGSAYTCNVAVR